MNEPVESVDARDLVPGDVVQVGPLAGLVVDVRRYCDRVSIRYLCEVLPGGEAVETVRPRMRVMLAPQTIGPA